MSTVKIGFLASGSGGNPSGVGDYVNKLDTAGIPAVVMCNDGVVGISDALARIKAGSTVPHVMAYRIVKDASEHWSVPNYSLSPEEAAVEYRDRLMPFINPVVRENRDRVWVFIGNELDKGRSDWLGYWGYESALLWNQAGYKVALFGFSSGEPEPEHWQTSGMLQFLQLAGQRPDQVAVNLHEYSYDVRNILNIYPWLIGRFQFMYKACDLHGIPRPKVLFGEWGWELDKTPAPGPGTVDVHNVADIYAPFANVLGGGLWYLGQYLNFNVHNKAQPLIAPVTDLAQSYSPRPLSVELMISPEQPPIDVSGPIEPDDPGQPGGGPGDVPDTPDDRPAGPGDGESAVEERLIDLDFTGLGISDVGVTRASWYDQGNVQVPIKVAGRQRWNYWEADGDNPFGDGQPWNDFRSPEGVHHWDAHLPTHEHGYLNDRGRCYHLFAPEGAWWARFSLDQRLMPGRYRLSLDIWGDWVDLVNGRKVPKPDPKHAQLELFISQEGKEEWISPPFAKQSVQLREFVVDSEGDYEVGFGILTVFAPGGRMAANGCFLRGFTLERLAAPVDEEPEEPVGGSTLAKYLWGASLPYDLHLNSAASLQSAIFADGFIPVGSERPVHFAGKKYIIQAAEHLSTGEKRLYYVEVPHWADIRFFSNPFEGEPTEPPVEPLVRPPAEPDVGFKYEFWPTKVMRVTQGFGENPEDYGPFLPGHEGIDLSSPMGTPYFAPKAGKVIWASDRRRSDGQLSLYGWHVIIDHGDGYSSLLAHALPDPPVAIGDMVAAGQIVAYSGNTGNSSGPHLHLTLKKAGHQLEGWPPGYMDPWPHLSHLLEQIAPPADPVTEGHLFNDYLEERTGELAVTTGLLNIRAKPFQMGQLLGTVREGAAVRRLRPQLENGYQLAEVSIPDIINYRPLPSGGGVDMLSYMRGDPGIMFEVRHPNGSQERFHTQDDPRNPAAWFYVKNALWEHWRVEGNYIRICSDVSPGDADDGTARYYIVRQNGTYGSPYCPRMMAEGDIYHDGGHFVQFYRKSNNDPHPQNSGFTSNTTTLIKRHGPFTFNSYGQNITLDDVIEVKGNTETHYFARQQGVSFGRVAWASPWGRSEISEIYPPGTRQHFGRLIVAGMILK